LVSSSMVQISNVPGQLESISVTHGGPCPKNHLHSVPFSAQNFSIVIQLSSTIQSTCVPSTLHLHVKDHSRHHWTHAKHRQHNSRAVSRGTGGVVTASCMHYVSVACESHWQSHPDWSGEFRSDQDFTTPIGSFAGVLDCPSGAALDPPSSSDPPDKHNA
jgi:hypothetical protein